jgi:hypothetical protein
VPKVFTAARYRADRGGDGGGQLRFHSSNAAIAELVECAAKKDPDVVGVVSVIGVSAQPTPNAGRLSITAPAQ